MAELPYAEDIRYWKTSKSSPGTWLTRASELIEEFGGNVWAEAWGNDAAGNRAVMLQFDIDGYRFKIIHRVLPSKTDNKKAADVQAATMLFHEVKWRCLRMMIYGARTAFFEYLLLEDGRTPPQVSDPELLENIPEPFRMLGVGQ